jgi:hypothetical protein
MPTSRRNGAGSAAEPGVDSGYSATCALVQSFSARTSAYSLGSFGLFGFAKLAGSRSTCLRLRLSSRDADAPYDDVILFSDDHIVI